MQSKHRRGQNPTLPQINVQLHRIIISKGAKMYSSFLCCNYVFCVCEHAQTNTRYRSDHFPAYVRFRRSYV
jgi:hypothetical protein